MQKLIQFSFILLLNLAILQPALASELVEIRLAKNLDEKRGYCLDIAGGKGKDAPIDKGLQAHTCYDYTGQLLEDQSFDSALLKQSTFKIPYFNVCMSASSIKVGADILLAPCADKTTQQFTLKNNGHLITNANSALCVTVSNTEVKKGRGGQPVHIMRPLSLQTCQTNNHYQIWSTFTL